MSKKNKKKRSLEKDLFLDRPTSHGGWPEGHSGSYTDPDTPVHKQISDYLKSMGLSDYDNPRARLSEDLRLYISLLSNKEMLRKLIRESIKSML